jgi:prepilin-type N-terminal cleavage/methylation domain-containing protein
MCLQQFLKLRANEKGFSFVEIIVAMVIMGMVLIPMFSMFDFGIRIQKYGEQDLVALNICQSKMEGILSSYFRNEGKLLIPNTTTEVVYQGQAYTVVSMVEVPNSRVQQVTVFVTYNSISKEKNVHLTTKVVEY